jgi:putative transposase
LDFHGGKVEVKRPDARARDGGEIVLPSWEAAMTKGLLDQLALNLELLLNLGDERIGWRILALMKTPIFRRKDTP